MRSNKKRGVMKKRGGGSVMSNRVMKKRGGSAKKRK